jgi:hypothetical protein
MSVIFSSKENENSNIYAIYRRRTMISKQLFCLYKKNTGVDDQRTLELRQLLSTVIYLKDSEMMRSIGLETEVKIFLLLLI